MRAAEHLSEGKIKRAQTALPGWEFGTIVATIRVIMNIVLMFTRSMSPRFAAGVPGGMHDSTLLRYKQQDYTEIMK